MVSGGSGGGLKMLCRRARFWVRTAWRGRTSTDWTTDTEDRHSMHAPLVEPVADSARASPTRQSRASSATGTPPRGAARERQSTAEETYEAV